MADVRDDSVLTLSKEHFFLKGSDKCVVCHEQPGIPSVPRCLKCHKKISEQIEENTGDHCDFGSDCVSCHTIHQSEGAGVISDQNQKFDHPAYDGFNLSGQHAELKCIPCHGDRFDKTINSQCGSCHQDIHKGGLGSGCSECHTTEGFRNASRAFHKSGTFLLEGKHLALECSVCHLRGEKRGTTGRCYDCHWIRRQDDPFRTQLGNECEDCHNPVSWTSIRFNHASASGVVLNAGHRTLECNQCHINNNFRNPSMLCYSCHQKDYQGTRNPNHITAGFSTDCEECHRLSVPSFTGVSFSHSSYYPLQGAHVSLDCSACHINNIYQGTAQDCFSCHQSDYQTAQDPNHIAAGFSTDCEVCHQARDLRWDEGQFLHPDFPINSGRHANFDCIDCHTDPLNYQVFSCLACHDRGDIDEEHGGIPGYIYNSQACYSCHPQGV